jgi:hypothetical protein
MILDIGLYQYRDVSFDDLIKMVAATTGLFFPVINKLFEGTYSFFLYLWGNWFQDPCG